jgi:hypothetical protein
MKPTATNTHEVRTYEVVTYLSFTVLLRSNLPVSYLLHIYTVPVYDSSTEVAVTYAYGHSTNMDTWNELLRNKGLTLKLNANSFDKA